MNTIDAIRARQSNGNVEADPIRARPDRAASGSGCSSAKSLQSPSLAFRCGDRQGAASAWAMRWSRHCSASIPQFDEASLEKERAKPLRAPLIIAVGVDQPEDHRVLEIENICAAAAACENILLAATEMGLASYWRTGDAARDPEVKQFLGLTPDQPLIAFLYLGNPTGTEDARERPGFEDRTTWIGQPDPVAGSGHQGERKNQQPGANAAGSGHPGTRRPRSAACSGVGVPCTWSTSLARAVAFFPTIWPKPRPIMPARAPSRSQFLAPTTARPK